MYNKNDLILYIHNNIKTTMQPNIKIYSEDILLGELYGNILEEYSNMIKVSIKNKNNFGNKKLIDRIDDISIFDLLSKNNKIMDWKIVFEIINSQKLIVDNILNEFYINEKYLNEYKIVSRVTDYFQMTKLHNVIEEQLKWYSSPRNICRIQIGCSYGETHSFIDVDKFDECGYINDIDLDKIINLFKKCNKLLSKIEERDSRYRHLINAYEKEYQCNNLYYYMNYETKMEILIDINFDYKKKIIKPISKNCIELVKDRLMDIYGCTINNLKNSLNYEVDGVLVNIHNDDDWLEWQSLYG